MQPCDVTFFLNWSLSLNYVSDGEFLFKKVPTVIAHLVIAIAVELRSQVRTQCRSHIFSHIEKPDNFDWLPKIAFLIGYAVTHCCLGYEEYGREPKACLGE